MTDARLVGLHQRLTASVLGAERPATLVLVALLAQGHVLIKGAPGVGKTSLVQALSTGFGGQFRRLQFTPDLLPSDILGYHLYRQHSGEFDFIEGPVFTNLLLADEINRTSPRVQSALLESMNEGQVTIDGVTRTLAAPFMVVATQNALGGAGTFPLPEPQLDRFLLSVTMEMPSRQVQHEILLKHAAGVENSAVGELLSVADVLELQSAVLKVAVSEAIAEYIVSLCEMVRRLAGGQHTVSVRASLSLQRAAQALAVVQGDQILLPDHVKGVFLEVMGHRVLPEDGGDVDALLAQVLERVSVR